MLVGLSPRCLATRVLVNSVAQGLPKSSASLMVLGHGALFSPLRALEPLPVRLLVALLASGPRKLLDSSLLLSLVALPLFLRKATVPISATSTLASSRLLSLWGVRRSALALDGRLYFSRCPS